MERWWPGTRSGPLPVLAVRGFRVLGFRTSVFRVEGLGFRV